jgi:hypothetical protein
MKLTEMYSLVSEMGYTHQLIRPAYIRGCIQKFPDWVDNERNNNNKHSLKSNTKSYGGKTD